MDTKNTMPQEKVIIMNGFSNDELVAIMKAVKGLYTKEEARDLIFAKTTPNSITMVLRDLIEDMSQDHEYLKANPPTLPSTKDGKQS